MLFVARAFSYLSVFARAYIIVLCSDVGRKLSINGYNLSPLPILTFVQQLCSHSGWLLLKWSAIGLGFNGAETNCRIAHVLGIQMMISY